VNTTRFILASLLAFRCFYNRRECIDTRTASIHLHLAHPSRTTALTSTSFQASAASAADRAADVSGSVEKAIGWNDEPHGKAQQLVFEAARDKKCLQGVLVGVSGTSCYAELRFDGSCWPVTLYADGNSVPFYCHFAHMGLAVRRDDKYQVKSYSVEGEDVLIHTEFNCIGAPQASPYHVDRPDLEDVVIFKPERVRPF